MSPACAVTCPKCAGEGIAEFRYHGHATDADGNAPMTWSRYWAAILTPGAQLWSDGGHEPKKCSLCNSLGKVRPEDELRYYRSIEKDGGW